MIQKWPVYVEPMKREMTVHVYLPDYYYKSEERFPVMYMFDGHNLFSDEDATYGTSWGMEEFLKEYDKPFIVVGLECDHRDDNRLQEYMPYPVKETFFGTSFGTGKVFMDWIVFVLKPLIDDRYRTWRHREATGIGGSSMGGLMAFYGLIAHNEIFSKAACLSPSVFICYDELINDLHSHYIRSDTRAYFSIGTKEMRGKRNLMNIVSMLEEFAAELELRDAYTEINIVEGGEHSESSWKKQNKEWYDFLWK